MAQYSSHTQCTRGRIDKFVASKTNVIETRPLTTPQLHSAAIFEKIKDRTSGPIDLLYSFSSGEHKPALGFQQVDGESDEEEQYTLVYVDPGLEQDWKTAR
ncbi:hypothetical protein ccbrp13_18590 [Ktedonobacteria bacterium brp13]|nr:hypothetical protein ccbrp13_18590 [Ktedonobacteria bacterium brp13]